MKNGPLTTFKVSVAITNFKLTKTLILTLHTIQYIGHVNYCIYTLFDRSSQYIVKKHN